MSNITLYNVKGLSEVDTIQFASIAERDAFFANVSARLDINTGFYPPHYQNVIKLDVPIDAPYNYLSLIYGDKTYYYFINTIQYVNEDIIAISITMDTIITFMFDVDFIQSHITRASIRRFNSDGHFNRDYLRENFSAGKFIPIKKKYYRQQAHFSLEQSNGGITGITVLKAPYPQAGMTYNTTLRLNGVDTVGLNDLFIFPYINGKQNYYFKDSADSYTYTMDNAYNRVAKTATNAVMAYYLPFCPINISAANTGQGYDFTLPTGLVMGDGTSSNYSITLQGNTTLSVNLLEDEFVPFYVTQPIAGDLFSKSFVPALLDDAYTKLYFGENATLSTINPFLSGESRFRLSYYGDIMTGARVYFIKPFVMAGLTTFINDTSIPYPIDDPYGTAVVASVPITVDINVNEFNSYYSYNKASTWASVGSAALSIAGVIGALL